MPHTLPPTASSEDESSAVEQAELRGRPFLLLRDPHGELLVIDLAARRRRYTIGRRVEADIPLGWDREVSRLHAQLERLAGEWTICDEGLSQNGTYVNEVMLSGRRRLADGDLIRLGRTSMTFRDPRAAGGGMTMLPGELGAATALSEQQHSVLRELCRPLVGDGDGLTPASDEAVAAALAIPLDTVMTEIDALSKSFGFDDLPPAEARAELALGCLRSGLVRPDDLTA
jgi:hypothetical protein